MEHVRLEDELLINPVDANEVRMGDYMLFGYWAKVAGVQSRGSDGIIVQCTNALTGQPFEVRGRPLVELAKSADYVAQTVTASRSKVAEIMGTSRNTPFKVCYTKKDGTERTLVGYMLAPDPWLGRSLVRDLEVKPGDPYQREVNHATIKWLIIEGTKYIVK